MTIEQIADGIKDINGEIRDLLTGCKASTYLQVGFPTDKAALSNLEQMLREVFEKAAKNASKDGKKDRDDANKTSKDGVEETKNVAKGLAEKTKVDKKHFDNYQSLLRHLRERVDANGKSSLTKMERALLFADDIKKSLKIIVPIVKDIGGMVVNNAKAQMEIVGELRQSGVILKKGFDESFYELATQAGMDRQTFAQALNENSKFIASVNATGMDGASLLSRESKKLVGTLGLTSSEIKSATKAYNDSMLTTANQADIANINHTEELMKSTKALKMFAMATGQSYENIIKEQKAKERSWQMQKLANDPKTRNQLIMMRNAGLSDELIESIMLNKANKASTMAMLDPNSAQMLTSMKKLYSNTKGDPTAFAQGMAKLSNSSAAEGMRQTEARTNPEDLAYVNGLGELYAPGSTQWGLMTSQRMGMNPNELLNGTDAQSVNAMQEFSSALNGLKNAVVEALTPSIKTITEWIKPGSAIHTFLSEITKWIAGNPFSFLITTGAILIGKGIAGTALSSWIQAKLFQRMGIGVQSGVEKGAKTLMNTSKWGKIGGILGRAVGAVGGHMLATSVGSAIGAGIGSMFGNSKVGSNIGRYLGAAVNGAIWGIKGGPWGMLAGAVAGIAFEAGKDIISNFFGSKDKDKAEEIANENTSSQTEEYNAPSNAASTSQYNSKNESYSNQAENEDSEDSKDSGKVAAEYTSVSVNGMSHIESLLSNINANTKAIVSEIRNSGFQVGTNLAT